VKGALSGKDSGRDRRGRVVGRQLLIADGIRGARKGVRWAEGEAGENKRSLREGNAGTMLVLTRGLMPKDRRVRRSSAHLGARDPRNQASCRSVMLTEAKTHGTREGVARRPRF